MVDRTAPPFGGAAGRGQAPGDDDVLVRPADLEPWMQARAERVLLVDGGGVLFNNVIEDSSFIDEVARTYRVPARELLTAYAARDSSFETDRCGIHEVLEACLCSLGCRPPGRAELERIDALYAASLVPNRALFALLRATRGDRRRGPILVLASNEAKRWDEIKDRAFGHLGLFDHVGSSWKIGACKPEPAYFDGLERALRGVPRAHWRLLDDNPAVVAHARALGVASTEYRAGVPGAQRVLRASTWPAT